MNYLYLTLKNKEQKYLGARAGIRTRVSGMKTRDDGPGYTTRANDLPCHLLFITIGHSITRQAFHFGSQESLDESLLWCS